MSDKYEVANKLSGMGAVITGSFALWALGLWENPDDVDAIFSSRDRDAIILRLKGQGFSYTNGSLSRSGNKLADLIFTSKVPGKTVTFSGITILDPECLLKVYRSNIGDEERRPKWPADQKKIHVIEEHFLSGSSLATAGDAKENVSDEKDEVDEGMFLYETPPRPGQRTSSMQTQEFSKDPVRRLSFFD